MLVNKAALQGVYQEFKSLYEASFANYPMSYDPKALCMFVPTNTITVTYNWLEDLPTTRKWVGDKVIKNLSASGFSVTSEEYENTLGVKRRDLEADNLGIYRPMITAMAADARHHALRLYATALTNASSATCFDGQYLCDTDHPGYTASGATTWSNAGTTALSSSAVDYYVNKMRKFTDNSGRIIGIRPTHIVVPLELEATALEILTSSVKIGASNSTPNVQLRHGLELVVIPELTNASAWFLMDLSKGVAPFIYQERKAPEFLSVDDLNDSKVFLTGEYLYGTESDYTIQPGFPQTIYGNWA